MQSIYAFWKSGTADLTQTEKFIGNSSESMYDLYLLMLSLLVEVKKMAEDKLLKSKQKYLATEAEKNPSRRFVDNAIFSLLSTNKDLAAYVEKRKLTNWAQDDEYVHVICDAIIQSEVYNDYMALPKTTFKQDQNFMTRCYRQVIAPNEKLYEYLEDKRLTWLDDFPLVNTIVVKTLNYLKANSTDDFFLPELYKDQEDKQFALDLFRKTILNDETILKEIVAKTPNWDKDRIADIDMVLLKMAISEFLYFPSIPVKATINEYLEVAKEYSTPKSSLFINGILDKLVKEYTEKGTLNKSGRGLM